MDARAVNVHYSSAVARTAPREKPRPYHHGDLRRALIDVALQLVAEKGVEGLTLREAARRAGVSQAAPYRHFPDKTALLLEVAEEGFRAMHQQILEALAQAPADTAARLSAIGVGYVRFAVAHPAHFRIMFGNELARSQASPTAEQTAMAVFRELAGEILKGQMSGVIRGDDPLGLAVAAWSMAHGLAAILVEGLLDPRRLGPAAALDPEALTRLATRLLIEGLAKR
ncbi:MAG: TetR/AcrR family transcriptional regulator [Vicinamibacteria bacterium]